VDNRDGEATVLGNLGAAYLPLSQYQRAIDYSRQALPIYREVGNRNGEAKSLTNLGAAYSSLGQYQQSIEYYQQALPIFRAVGDRNTEGLLLANIGRLYAANNSPQSAIQQLKLSVEVREVIRAELRQLPQASQQAYTDSIADDYRFLAELLKQQNRNQEAQAILNLL
jgi:tetratricopeptide (TPR) repeat protein